MLKIAEGIDLKELLKFEFKPKYNVNTGEIEMFIYEATVSTLMNSRDVIFLEIFRQVDTKKWVVDVRNAYGKGLDTLYDLIQAGIVVKE